MSQQINLYEERLRPRHDLVTARNLGASALALLVLITAWAAWADWSASRHAVAAAVARWELKDAQEKIVALTKSQSALEVSPALETEVENARNKLAARTEAMQFLDTGRLGKTTGFSAFMTGFAQQAQNDLWLTGFVIAAGGDDIEISGRMLNASRLPTYVQRLSSQPIFQGRRFAALDMKDVDLDAQGKASSEAAGAAEKTGASSSLSRYVEFELRSERAEAADAQAARGGRK